jgi:membrane protease YdiL (CAAX protease family)
MEVLSTSSSATTRERALRDLLEIVVIIAVIEAALWTEGRLQKDLTWFAGIVICAIVVWNRRYWKELGLAIPSKRSLAVILAATVIAGLAIAIAAAMGTLHQVFGPRPPILHTLEYLPWAIAQQFILNGVIFVRVRSILSRTTLSALVSAFIFGSVHFPNPVLTLVTAVGGFLLCLQFARHRTIWPLGVAHFIVGIALAVSAPDQLLRHMRVGAGYWHFHR